MRRIIIYLTVMTIFIGALDATARRKTTRPSVHKSAVKADTPADTLSSDWIDSLIRITGYEKPLRANNETIFVAYNIEPDTFSLMRLDLRIEYFDMSGAMLHSRVVTVYPDIPGGERHLVRIPTWDRNNVFYYHLNPPRTSAQATPYRVRIYPLTALRQPIKD